MILIVPPRFIGATMEGEKGYPLANFLLDTQIDSMESIFYFPLSLTLQNSIGNGEFSFDANFVSPEFLGEVAEEMDSLDKTFLFSTVDLW